MVLIRSPFVFILLSTSSTLFTLSNGLTTPTPKQQQQNRREFFSSSLVATTTAVTAGTSLILGTPKPTFAATTTDTSSNVIPKIGNKAPQFELPNSRGTGEEKTSLSSLTKTGKWTVLYFYPGAFTQGCTLEARGFQKDYDIYQKLNTQVVGVSVDDVNKNSSFCSEEKLNFYMLSDYGGLVSKLYGSAKSVSGVGSLSQRQTYIIDPSGILRWVFTDVESNVPKHSSDVLSKLEELQQQKV